MTWLAGLVPYKQVTEIFERIGHVHVPTTVVWEQVQAVGKRWTAQQQHRQEQVSVERVVLPAAGQDHSRPKGLSMDGGMVNIRGEGWKEFKVGTVYDITSQLEVDPETQEEVRVARGENITYLGVLGSAEEFGRAFWALAVEQAVPQAAEVVTTADGAEWIWNLTSDYFPQSVQIVDWYHATEHVAQAAGALYPQDVAAAQRWNQAKREALYLGQISQLTTPLEKGGWAPMLTTSRFTNGACNTRRFENKAIRLARAVSRAVSGNSNSG